MTCQCLSRFSAFTQSVHNAQCRRAYPTSWVNWSLLWIMALWYANSTSLAAGTNEPDKRPNESAKQIELAAVKTRKLLRRGHVVITFDGHSSNKRHSGRWDVWFDFDTGQVRADLLNAQNHELSTSCFGCGGREDRHIFHSDKVVGDGGHMSIMVRPSAKVSEVDRAIPNLQILGLVAIGCRYSMKMSLESLEREIQSGASTVELSELDGIKCWLVKRTNELPNARADIKIHTNTWIAVGDRADVLKIVAESSSPDGQSRGISTLRCQPPLESGSGVSLPGSLRYESVINGNTVLDEELKIAAGTLNKELPPNTFELSGLKTATPGSYVTWLDERDRPEPQGLLVWDGQKIVQDPRMARTRLSANNRETQSMHYALIVGNVVVLCALIVVFILRRRRQKGTK